MQVVCVILARESQTKPREMWEKSIKDDTWIGILIKKVGRLFILNIQFYLYFILFDMKLVSLTMKYTPSVKRKQAFYSPNYIL
jgi:hypothetical protein